MTNEEVQAEAHRIQALHKLPCAIVATLEERECIFGFAIANGLEDKVLPLLSAKLREWADNLDKKMATVRAEMVLKKAKSID